MLLKPHGAVKEQIELFEIQFMQNLFSTSKFQSLNVYTIYFVTTLPMFTLLFLWRNVYTFQIFRIVNNILIVRFIELQVTNTRYKNNGLVTFECLIVADS